MPRPHRWRRIALWTAGVIVLLPAAVLLLVLIVANTAPGRSLIETQVASLTGGMVRLTGLSGRFPDALRLAHLEVHDRNGAYVTLDGVVLDWSPTALFGRVARIDTLTADHLVLSRLPVSAPAAKPAPPSNGGFSLPVRVDLLHLAIARADLGAPVAGAAAQLTLSGAGQFQSLDAAQAKLTIDRLDAPGRYHLDGQVNAATIQATLNADEPPSGLISGLARLPALGALALHATIEGPRAAERLDLTLGAGALNADAHGTVDLVGHSAALDVAATAPAMSPRPDISWGGIELAAHVHGPFTGPKATGHAQLRDLKAGGASIANLTLDASGDRGVLDAHAVLTGLILPPPQPNLFAAAPLDLTVHTQLDQPSLPIHVELKHPLLAADADLHAAGDLTARLHTVIPNLQPFAAIGHADIQGSTEAVATLARHNDISDVTVDGTAHFTGGQAPLPTVLGHTTFGATARLDGQDITISRAIVDGRAAHLDATGADLDGKLAFAWHVALSDLAALSPQLAGRLEATGRAETAADGLAVQADMKGDVGTPKIPRGPIQATIRATGLPGNPAGTVSAQGRLAGSPLQLDADLQRLANGDFHAVLKRAGWKSLAATADMILAKGETVPIGTLTARMTRLADLSALTGQKIEGSVSARIATTTIGRKPDAKIDVQATSLALGPNAISHASLTGHVRDPATAPEAALTLAADGIAAAGITGQAHATVNGPQTALLLHTDAALTVQGTPATQTATARLDAPAHLLALTTMDAAYRGETLHLRAPARVTFGAQTAVDRLLLAFGPSGAAPATLEIAGRIAPQLALTATLRHVTPALAKPFAPKFTAVGDLSADATLSGTTAAPTGTIHAQALGLSLKNGSFGFLAPATVHATAVLDGHSAHLDARASAGPKLSASLSGTVPLQTGAPLALHVGLINDLSLLNPILGATGQRAAGNLAVNATVTGTQAAPQINGTVTLDHGEIQDYVQGVHIIDIAANLSGAGDSIRIDAFTAKAGPGTFAAGGTIGILAPGLPINLHFTARNARPLTSDLLTATLDADLRVTGQARSQLAAAGHISVRNANINIPNALPPSVAVLHVRRPGDKPPPATAPPAVVTTLAIDVDAPSQIFVRGHGLDSELGGTLTIGGTTAAPQIDGGFEMRRGSISVAGTTLDFSTGKVGFDGTSVTNKIDPTLDFVADSTAGGVTATLTVGGYADAPTIKLSSVPDLPQDEVLAQLLFGTSVKDLSAIQIAEIASALAELTGVTGSGSDPLGAVRRGLGLDRLSVGGGSGSGTGATVEAGRYVARGVYVGAKQATSGGGTAAEVQIDLTRHLKAKAQLATGGGTVQGATPDNDPGSTIGLSYQFEY